MVMMMLMFVSYPALADTSIEIGSGIRYTNGIPVFVIQDVKKIQVIAGGWYASDRSNLLAGIQKGFHYKRLRFDIGAVYLRDKNERIGTHMNFTIAAFYHFNKKRYAGYRHFSNGDKIFDNENNYGRDGKNLGEDFGLLGFTF